MVSPSTVRSSGVSSIPVPSAGRSEASARARARAGGLLVELGAGGDGVDQAPLHGLGAPDALGAGGEHVGQVAPDVALVDDPGEPAGAGQHAEKRNLRERHRRRPVVDQQDVVTGQGQLVAAAGGGAVDGRHPDLLRGGGGVLDGVAGLVGELAEVHLVVVGGPGQHLDVGAGAEHLVEPAADHHRPDLGMLEAEALDDVVEFDVDAEVVGVQLELVALVQAAVGVDLHRQARQGRLDRQPPVTVRRRMAVEGDGLLGAVV